MFPKKDRIMSDKHSFFPNFIKSYRIFPSYRAILMHMRNETTYVLEEHE